jgi:hypothetical protein
MLQVRFSQVRNALLIVLVLSDLLPIALQVYSPYLHKHFDNPVDLKAIETAMVCAVFTTAKVCFHPNLIKEQALLQVMLWPHE